MKLRQLLLLAVLVSCPAWAATYYVDYVNGSDTNPGTSTLPWKHAPEMSGCSVGAACHITLQPDDHVIFKGGIRWSGTDSFTWVTTASGTPNHPIVYGTDPSYYDTAGCQQVLGVTITNPGSGYSVTNPPTPVFSAGAGAGATGYVLLNTSGGIQEVVMIERGTGYSAPFTVTFSSGTAQGTAVVNSGWCRPILDANHVNFGTSSGYNTIVFSRGNYVTFQNFEEVHQSAGVASISQSMNQLIAGNGQNFSMYNIFDQFYIHNWDSSYCFGKGNIAANSNQITGFSPISGQCTTDLVNQLAANSATPQQPIQVFPQGLTYWPVQSNGPVITAITGSNPYTITTNSSTLPSVCTNCWIQFGGAAGASPQSAFYGDAAGNTGSFVTNSIIDGRDTAPVQLNPYADCGAAVGLNNPCIAPSLVANWRAPHHWVGNTIQYIDNGAVGGCGVVASNLIQFIRVGSNPTGHSNIWESIYPLGDNSVTGCLMYNNFWGHSSMRNPNAPGDTRLAVGLSIQPAPKTGQISYLFNNVFTDTILNTVVEPAATATGNVIEFNNTMDCGTAWSLIYACTGTTGGGGTTTVINDLYLTTSPSPLTTATGTFIKLNPSTASTFGFSLNTPYIYSPQSVNCNGNSPCTVGAGSSIAAYCTALDSLYPAAGAACRQDTGYGALYDPVRHTSSANARSPVTRSTSTPDVGAFQFADTFYVSQNGGVFSGVGACNGRITQTPSWFNTTANWSNPKVVGKIGPGDSVYLCGTFTSPANTNLLQFQGSGNTGVPITLIFDTGALLQSPYWPGGGGGGSTTAGAINTNLQTNIVISGGPACGFNIATLTTTPCNGVIQNTADGSVLQYQQPTNGVVVTANTAVNVEVKNITIQNLYMRSGSGDEIDNSSENCIILPNGATNSTFTIDHVICHDASWGVFGGTNSATVTFGPGNDFYNLDHDIATAPTTIVMYGNHLHDWAIWDNPAISLTLSSVAAGTGVYTGTITNGANNGLAGYKFLVITGFTNAANNGTFAITASTATTITTNNTSSVAESAAATGADGGTHYHHDGLHCYAGPAGATNAIYVYANLFDGNTGNNMQDFVFEESSATNCFIANALGSAIFNNIMIQNTASQAAVITGGSSFLQSKSQRTIFANNLLLSNQPNQKDQPASVIFGWTSSAIFANNAMGGYSILSPAPAAAANTTWTLINYDYYENCSGFNCFWSTGPNGTSVDGGFAAWQSTGADLNGGANLGSTTYFGLPAACAPGALSQDCTPVATSPLLNAGTNLTSYCTGQPNPGLGALCSDAYGNPRPTIGAWNVGPIQGSTLPPSTNTYTFTPVMSDVFLFTVIQFQQGSQTTFKYHGSRQ